MLPYRKCQTWELSEKEVVGSHLAEDFTSCMTTASARLCRIAAKNSAGSGRATSACRGPRSPFFRIPPPGDLLAAAAAVAATGTQMSTAEQPERADIGLCCGPAVNASTFLKTTSGASKPAATGFHTSSLAVLSAALSSAGKTTSPATSVIHASTSKLSVALSPACRHSGLPPRRCTPVLRKYRSFDSWLSPSTTTTSPPLHSCQEQQYTASAAVGTAAAECGAPNSTRRDDRGVHDRRPAAGVTTVPGGRVALATRIAAGAPTGRGATKAAKSSSASAALEVAGGAPDVPAAAAADHARDGSIQKLDAAVVSKSGDFRKYRSSITESFQKEHIGSGTPWQRSPPLEKKRNNGASDCDIDRPEQSDNACEMLRFESFHAEKAVAPVGADNRDGGGLPLLHCQQSQQELDVFGDVPAEQMALTCISADSVQRIREIAQKAERVESASATVHSTATADSHTRDEPNSALAGTENNSLGSLMCQSEAAASNPASEHRISDASDTSGLAFEKYPSSASTLLNKGSWGTSEMSGPAELVSEDEPTKTPFSRMEMMIPAATNLEGKPCSIGSKKISGASPPAACDSFSSTSPDSVCGVSVHSFSLPYSASSVILPLSKENAADETRWSSGNLNRNRNTTQRKNTGALQRHQGGRETRVRSFSYPPLAANLIAISENMQGRSHALDQKFVQVEERRSGSRADVLSRGLCSSSCNDSPARTRPPEQLQRRERGVDKEEEEKDSEKEKVDESQQLEEVVKKQRNERKIEVRQQQGQNSVSDGSNGAHQGGPPTRLLSSEGWRNSSGVGGFCSSCACEETASESSRDGSSRLDSPVSTKVSPVVSRHPARAEVPPMCDVEHTLTVSSMSGRDTPSTIPVILKRTAQQTSVSAAAALVSPEETFYNTTEEERTCVRSNAEVFSGELEAVKTSEKREAIRTPQKATLPGTQFVALERNQREAVPTNAEEDHTMNDASHPFCQVSLVPLTASKSAARDKSWRDFSPGRRCMKGSHSFRRSIQNPDETPSPVAADSIGGNDNTLCSELVNCPRQRAAATQDVPINQSPPAERISEVKDFNLTIKRRSTSAVDEISYGVSSCSRSATAEIRGTNIPRIHLCTPQVTDDKRESCSSTALKRKQRTSAVDVSVLQSTESGMEVSVASRSECWHPVPNISFDGIDAIGYKDMAQSTASFFRGSQTRCSSGENRPLTRTNPSTPRGSTKSYSGMGNRGERLSDGNDIKRPAELTGVVTPKTYGRYLGVADVSTGQSLASLSTMSTASPYSCSGFSSSYSLPSSSTPVLGSQLYTSASAATVSPSPVGTTVEETTLTAKNSPVVAGTGTGGREGNSSTSISFGSGLSNVNSPCLPHTPSPASSGSGFPKQTDTATLGLPVTNETDTEFAAQSPADVTRSLGAPASGSSDSDRCGVSAAAALSSLTAARLAGTHQLKDNEVISPVRFGAMGESGRYIDISGGSIQSGPSAVSRGSWATSIACGSSQYTDEDAESRVTEHANDTTNGGDYREGSGRRCIWRLSMRRMFSSKSLLRWRTAIAAISSKQEASQAPMKENSAPPDAQQQQLLPKRKSVSADKSVFLCRRDVKSSVAAAGSACASPVIPDHPRAASGAQSRGIMVEPPQESRMMSARTDSSLQRTSNSTERCAGRAEKGRSFLCSAPMAHALSEALEVQVTPRHEHRNTLQQQGIYAGLASSNKHSNKHQAWRHPNFVTANQAPARQHEEEYQRRDHLYGKEHQTAQGVANCKVEQEAGVSGLEEGSSESIYPQERETNSSLDGRWMPPSSFFDHQQSNARDAKQLEHQFPHLKDEQAVPPRRGWETLISSLSMPDPEDEHRHRVPREAPDQLFHNNAQEHSRGRGQQQVLGVEQHQEGLRESVSVNRQGGKGDCGLISAELQQDEYQAGGRTQETTYIITGLLKETREREKQTQSGPAFQKTWGRPLSDSLDVLQRQGWTRCQEDQVKWLQAPDDQPVPGNAGYAMEGDDALPVGRSPCVSRRGTSPSDERTRVPCTSHMNLPVLSRSLSSPLSLSPSSSTGGSASPKPTGEYLNQFFNAVAHVGNRVEHRQHGAPHGGVDTATARSLFWETHFDTTLPAAEVAIQDVKHSSTARGTDITKDGTELCATKYSNGTAALRRIVMAGTTEPGGRQQASEGTGRVARSQSSCTGWRIPCTRQMSRDGDVKRMCTWSPVAQDSTRSYASYSALTASERMRADKHTSGHHTHAGDQRGHKSVHTPNPAISKETLLFPDFGRGTFSMRARESDHTPADGHQRRMRSSQEERTSFETSGVSTCTEAEGHVSYADNGRLVVLSPSREDTTHKAVTASPSSTATQGFQCHSGIGKVGLKSTSSSVATYRRGRSATAASVVRAELLHGAISAGGAPPEPESQAAGVCGDAAHVKNSLKREKKLIALACIKDLLNASTPRSQRQGVRRGRTRPCNYISTGFEDRVDSGGDESVVCCVSDSSGTTCAPSGLTKPSTLNSATAADDAAHKEAAVERGSLSGTSKEMHDLLKQHDSIQRVATVGAPADFCRRQFALHMCPNRRSCPHLAATGGWGFTQRSRPAEQPQMAAGVSDNITTHEHEKSSSSGTGTGLQHHIRRFLHLWADGEPNHRNDTSDSLAPCDRTEREGQQQQQRYTGASPFQGGEQHARLNGSLAAFDSVHIPRRSAEQGVAAENSNLGTCRLRGFPADVHGKAAGTRCTCCKVGTAVTSTVTTSSTGQRSIPLHIEARRRQQSGLNATLCQCKSENFSRSISGVHVRQCVAHCQTHMKAAENAAEPTLSYRAHASAADAVMAAPSRPTFERNTAAVGRRTLSTTAADFSFEDAAALSEKTGLSGEEKPAASSSDVWLDRMNNDAAIFEDFSSPSTSLTITRQPLAAIRRSNTAVLLRGNSARTVCAGGGTGRRPRSPLPTSAWTTLLREEEELTSSEFPKAVVVLEDSARSKHQLRLLVEDQRQSEPLQVSQGTSGLQQRHQTRVEDECQGGTQTMMSRERLVGAQSRHGHSKQPLWSGCQDEGIAAAAADFERARSTNLLEHEEHLGDKEPETSLSHSSPSPAVFGAAGLQSFLVFPRKETEESYRQQLSCVFSFRLRIVGVALVLLHILHLVWGLVRTAPSLRQNHTLESRTAAMADTAQVGLYAVLCLGTHLHRNKVSLETWTCALFSMAFAARFCALVATILLGLGASQFSAADDNPAAADDGLVAAYSGAVSYQLVRLSLCCIFHVLVCGMMLPARTLTCLPMHAFHFGGCLVASGAAATFTHLNLDPDGTICALSACLYTVLGFVCQAQLEASQRQLYVRWKDTQKGLQDMRQRRKQRSLSSADLTGVEQVAMLVRQSQMLLRDAEDGGHVHSKEGLFEQLASLQKEILEIVTDVRSMYNEQMGKGEIYELLNFVPEGRVLEPPVATKVCHQQEMHSCMQPTCIDRSWWKRQQREPLLAERPNQKMGTQEGGAVPYLFANESLVPGPGSAVTQEAEKPLTTEVAAAVAVQAARVAPSGLACKERQPPTTAHGRGASRNGIFEECAIVAGEAGEELDRSPRFHSSGIDCSYAHLFEAELEELSVVKETLGRLQREAANRREEIGQEPASAAVELIRKLGNDWEVNFFEIDKYTEGNTLRLTGEVQLSPLIRPDGLRCEMRVLRRFLHCLQRQYRVTNPYHNQLHAAMVSHCCLVLVGECLSSREALTYNDEICLCVAALAHDMGHPGLTNQYLINCQSLLATTYNDIAILENYHAACCFRTASHREDLNIFADLPKDIYAYMRQNIIGLILATDMSKHISYISRLRACMKAADLAHTATSWAQHKRWSELLCEEFYRQGDEERKLGLPVVETFDRKMAFRFPQSQYRFIRVVVEPLLEAIVDVEALLHGRGGVRHIICKHVTSNRRRWRRLAIAAGVGSPEEREEDTEDEHEMDYAEEEQKIEPQRTVKK